MKGSPMHVRNARSSHLQTPPYDHTVRHRWMDNLFPDMRHSMEPGRTTNRNLRDWVHHTVHSRCPMGVLKSLILFSAHLVLSTHFHSSKVQGQHKLLWTQARRKDGRCLKQKHVARGKKEKEKGEGPLLNKTELLNFTDSESILPESLGASRRTVIKLFVMQLRAKEKKRMMQKKLYRPPLKREQSLWNKTWGFPYPPVAVNRKIGEGVEKRTMDDKEPRH
ncbi:Hypothetical predicted protein [Podarcis lilfordi]|uniref:Uncharacterized protein n=1 Tax=Podarcis lilfordi TaxID=74358 RepID=A0AA35KKQ8_9SAUR|nr:Hypothetical predicted protein [Podarcis lilfordi]